MNDTDKHLLDQFGVIVLPESIDHDAYRHVLEAILRIEDKHHMLTVYCDGDGGYGRNALSIAGLLMHHRDVTGVIVGEAHSCHSVIFMACAHRFVHPAAGIGIHMGFYHSIDKPVDSRHARNVNLELERGERQIARIYAQASDKECDETYWYDRLQKVGSSGVEMIDADKLIAMGIARPIAEWNGILCANGNGPTRSDYLPLSSVGEGAGG